MDRQAFLARRRTGIGGSDVGPICGVDPFRGPLDVYNEKVGAWEEPDNPNMDAGRRLEPIVKDLYVEDTGRTLKRARFRRHRKHTWLIGHADAIVGGLDPDWMPGMPGDPAELPSTFEAKVMKTWAFTRLQEKGISVSHQLQGQHYGILNHLPSTTFGFLDRVEWRFASVRVDCNRKLQDQMVDICGDFWYNHVQKKIPPADVMPDWKIDMPEVEAGSIVQRDDPEWREVIARHREAKQMDKDATLLYDQAKHAVKKAAGAFGTYEGGQARAYYRMQDGKKTFNQKRLLAAQLLDPVLLVEALEGEGYHLEQGELRTIMEASVVSNLDRFNVVGEPFEVLQVYHSAEEE